MTRTGWLVVAAATGIAIFGLSFVEGWIVHELEVRGEGFRRAEILLSAWRAVAVPVLSVGVLAALAGGVVAALFARGHAAAIPTSVVPSLAATSLALIAISAVPLGWDGFTTSVDLRPGWLLALGLLLALVMTYAAVRASGPARTPFLAVALVVVGAGAAGLAGREITLELAGGNNEAWSEGTYVRGATADRPAQTLTIRDGRYTIGDRWAGTWEGSGGWTVVLDDDPACPGSRGAYHAHDAGASGEDLRFVMVVDTCSDGERAADLQAGIWERQP